MTRFLITPSLHDAFRFYRLLETKTKADMLAVLRKEPRTPTDVMLAGIRFENDVLRYTLGEIDDNLPPPSFSSNLDCVRQIADQVSGGLWQERVMFDWQHDGREYLVYGRMDVIKGPWIYDIKWSESYEVGKYTPSIQHKVYMHGAGIPNFRYLITDECNVYHEDYHMDDDMRDDMFGQLADLVDSIMTDDEMREAFEIHWVAKG